MQTPPEWLQIYTVAKLCRRSHFSRELTVTLMSWMTLPCKFAKDFSKSLYFFGNRNLDGRYVWDDMLVVRKRTRSMLYMILCSNFRQLLTLCEYEVGYKKAVECPW